MTDLVQVEKQPKRVGRPLKYCKDMGDILVEMAMEGRTEAHFRVKVRVSKFAFDSWKKKYPEFAEACDIAASAYEAFWVDQVSRAALSPDKANQTLLVKMLEYSSDRARKTSGSTEQAPIQINVNTYNDLSAVDRQSRIKELIEKARTPQIIDVTPEEV